MGDGPPAGLMDPLARGEQPRGRDGVGLGWVFSLALVLGCWGVCEAPWKGWRQDFLQQLLLLGSEEGTVWGGEVQLPMGWTCFTHLTTQR